MIHWYKFRDIEFLIEGTGERVRMRKTDQVLVDFEALRLQLECKHSAMEVRKIRVANGSFQLRNVCCDCKEAIGNPIKASHDTRNATLLEQSERDSAKIQLEALFFEHGMALAEKHARLQAREGSDYSNYLKSDKWRRKRELVVKRCGGVCEGCGEAKVTEIHHRTYENLYNEFLFELYGLCSPCHERIHADDEDQDSDLTVTRGS